MRGFTLVEIIIVMMIIVAAATLTLLYAQTAQVRNDLNFQTSFLIDELRLAHSAAKSGNGNSPNGIHLQSGSVTTFFGSSYNANDPQNQENTLPPTIRIQNINLNGGGQNIIFLAPDGETQNYGVLQLYSQQINQTKQINISQIGKIEYQ